MMRLPAFRRRSAAALLADQRGVSAVELGLLAPLLVVMTIGIIDFSMGLSHRFELHQAVHRSVELVAANRDAVTQDDGQIDQDQLKADVAEVAGVTPQDVSVTLWLECDGVEQDDYSSTCDSGEPTARYIQLRVNDAYEPMFAFAPWQADAGDDGGEYPIYAEAAVRLQ